MPDAFSIPMLRIVVLYPTRERAPASIEKLVREIALLSGPPHQHHVRIIVGLDEDDPTLLDALSRMRWVHEMALAKGNVRVDVRIGTSRDKVHAMNRLVPDPDSFDVLIGHSDDMEILADNWDDIAVRPLFERFPDGDGTVLIPDGNRADILTWPVVGSMFLRKLPWNCEKVTSHGAVIHQPSGASVLRWNPREDELWDARYRAICCDDALTEVAIRRNRMHIGSSALIRHLHPAYKTRERDQTDRKWTPLEAADRATLERHRAGGFGVEKPLLSILTPTIPGREGALDRLRAVLADEVGHSTSVEWIVGRFPHRRDGGPVMGVVRNRMLAAALGEWCMFIDDDDVPAPGVLGRIVNQIGLCPSPPQSGPSPSGGEGGEGRPAVDVIGFDTIYRKDRSDPAGWQRFRHGWGLAWVNSPETVDGVRLAGYRGINHLNPVRTSIARAVGFPEDAHWREDHLYSDRLFASGLVRGAVQLNEVAYIYETPSDPQREW